MIKYFSENVKEPVFKRRLISKWVKDEITKNFYQVGEISIIFTNDENILSINKKYLNHNYFTDIITFNYNEGKLINGDIFISVDTVAQNAKIYNVSYQIELFRVIIHGILHLIGYDDQTNEQQRIMTEMEDSALQSLSSILS